MKKLSTALALMALAFTNSSYAGEQQGHIVSIVVRASDGLISVELENSHVTRPPCAIYTYWMVRSESSLAGKQQYAALLGAKLSGKTVRIVGSNQCTRWPDGEDIDSLYIVD